MINDISQTTKKLLGSAVKIHQTLPEKKDVSYQHKVLAQTYFPYRNQKDVVKWERYNGNTALIIRSVEVINPKLKKAIVPGLPYGPKARILMICLNQQAIINDNPVIDVEDNMTAFLKRVHGSALSGTQIKAYKEQMTRLASCDFIMAMNITDDRVLNRRGSIVKEFDLWFPKDGNQKVLWSSQIRLSDDYFETLKNHLVPLDERAVKSLSHSAMGLDLYTWLAQRLHRIPAEDKQFITWKNLKDQFGHGYKKMGKFKEVFRRTLEKVFTQYPKAGTKVKEEKNKGFWLTRADPPVPYQESEKKEIKVH